MGKLCFVALALIAVVSPAHAWTCADTASGGGWKQVPTGTIGNGVGDGNLQVQVIDGITFQCQPATPPFTPTGGNSNATSSSQATSTSGSQSSATGGKATSTATGGTSSATGGNATGGNSSSGVSNSGNSSNTNNNLAYGGQGGAGGNATAAGGNQKQTQSQSLFNSGNSTATASGNGVGNGNNSNDSTVNYPRQVSTAMAPEVFPTVPCFKGFSAAAQGAAFGASFGSGKIDENCAELEAARQAPTRIARCKVYLLNKYVQKAGVTFQDCLGEPVPMGDNRVVVQTPAPVPQIVVNVPAINVPAPVIIEQQMQAPSLPIVVKPLPPPVKQRRPIKPCVQTTCPPQAQHKSVWGNEDVEKLNPANQ